MDIYTQVSRRAHYEDILSIVETNFMPYGIETEHYSIIGNILDCSLCENDYTKEPVYLLNVETNEMLMAIAINEKKICSVHLLQVAGSKAKSGSREMLFFKKLTFLTFLGIIVMLGL